MVTLPGLPIVQDAGLEGISSGEERDTRCLRKSQGYTVSQIVMDMCMLNIFLHWGTVHWQYVSRGLVSIT